MYTWLHFALGSVSEPLSSLLGSGVFFLLIASHTILYILKMLAAAYLLSPGESASWATRMLLAGRPAAETIFGRSPKPCCFVFVQCALMVGFTLPFMGFLSPTILIFQVFPPMRVLAAVVPLDPTSSHTDLTFTGEPVMCFWREERRTAAFVPASAWSC